jgi:phosphoribosyl 1,2-cyclic phosphodiesterase
MVRMTVLASGSRGNSTLVSSSRTRILVDAGLSCRELFKRMKAAGEDPTTLDAILITHEHQDHVQGVSVTARKLGIPVYFTEPTHRAWMRWMVPQKRMTYADWLAQRKSENEAREAQPEELQPDECAEPLTPIMEAIDSIYLAASDDSPEELKDPCALPGVEYFQAGSGFSIGDIAVTPFTIPHDAADPCGFVFTAEGIRIAIATDLGYMPSNVQMHLQRCDVLMLESNHDLEMLRDGPYPWSVKQRVMSRVGHLSNGAASKFLERTYDGHATYVILAHLSESNNLPELARISAERALQNRMSLLGNKLILARQSEPIEAISL